MPIRETVTIGREFLDVFGAENNGWRVLTPEESFNRPGMPELPRELLIPEISDEAIATLGKHLQPAKPDLDTFHPFVALKAVKPDMDPRRVAYTWGGEDETRRPLGIMSAATYANTLHMYGYYGLFKPSIAEVLGRIGASYSPNETIEYFWTTPVGDGDIKGVMWPNAALEVYTKGEHYSVEKGAYHLGRTAVYSLMPDDEHTRHILSQPAGAAR